MSEQNEKRVEREKERKEEIHNRTERTGFAEKAQPKIAIFNGRY